jgi:hypothetical protein
MNENHVYDGLPRIKKKCGICGGALVDAGFFNACVQCANTEPLGQGVQPESGQLAHEKPIAYIAGALNDMSCAYLGNVRKMILWAEKVRELGYAVFIPGIDLLCGIACDDWNYDVCFNNSQPFLAKSDIVFVCPGWENSKGTKRELDTACDLGIQIYYGEVGYRDLQHKPIDKLMAKMADNMAAAIHGEIKRSDEESARDRRRPFKDLHNSATDELDRRKSKDGYITAQELNDEALAELERRIANPPFRNGAKTGRSPGDKSYMRADEGTYDEHVEPSDISPVSISDNKCCGTCKYYEEINKFDSGTSGGACRHLPTGLSWAYTRLKPETHSDYGTNCDVWSTKYRC